MEQRSQQFLQLADQAMGESERARNRETLGAFMPQLREQAVAQFGDFDALREQLKAIRQHALNHLGHYLSEYIERARENGTQVHLASDADALNEIVVGICEAAGARRVAKGKSMITEETGLNAALTDAGLAVRETDLGEYIIQQAGETPSHIVGPALHKSASEIRELFLECHDLGERELADAGAMVAEARQVLRQDFLSADVGIIGSNALIAENGYSMLVTNEGNGDLCANLPPVLIICTSVDRVLPRSTDAMAMQRLLVRSTTGQAITCYTSFYGRGRREEDIDGALETHVVLLDNQRSELLASDYREILQCIRCGACLNHCPVYMSAGGHAYGWVYPGPMGSVLTPLLTSLEESHLLPDACTGCGRCEEVCPAGIPLPDLLRDLRAEAFAASITARRWRLGIRMHAWLASHPQIYRPVTNCAVFLMHHLGGREGIIRHLPFAGGWLSQRDLPAPPARSFQTQYKQRKKRPRAQTQ
ncbi:MAG: L-lactate dehydrogenase complex protein LldF [Halieaceae bacterium]|jgi:L-lactate dehydrogenase complex protein LldF